MNKIITIFIISSLMLVSITLFNINTHAASKKTQSEIYTERLSRVEGDIEKLRNDLYITSIEAANRSGQATSRLITFVGIIATIFGIIIALAGLFVGYEGMRARRKGREAMETLEGAKLLIDAEVQKLREKSKEVEKLIEVNLDQLKQDTETAAKKIEETSSKKIEELEAIDLTLEREGKIESLEKRIKFFEEIGMPDDPKLLYSKAMMLKEKGMKEESIELLRKVVILEPENWDAFFYIGYLEHDLKNYKESLEAYKTVIRLDPLNSGAYNNMGVTYKALGDNEKALEYYSKAIEIKPKVAHHYSNKLTVLKELEKWDEALECVQKLLELEPSGKNYKMQAEILEKLDRGEEALESINKSLELEPNDENRYKIKLRILEKLGQEIGLEETLRKMVGLWPTDRHKRFLLARFLNRKGRLDEAHDEYQTALNILTKLIDKDKCVDNDSLMLEYVELSIVAGFVDDAEAFLEKIHDKIKSDVYLCLRSFLKICLLSLRGKQDKAFKDVIAMKEMCQGLKKEEAITWNFDDINPLLEKSLSDKEYRVCLAIERLLKRELTPEEYAKTMEKLEIS